MLAALALFNSPIARILVVLAIVAGLVGTGAYLEHGRMQKKVDAVQAAYDQFKGGVAALGKAAEIATAKKTLDDLNVAIPNIQTTVQPLLNAGGRNMNVLSLTSCPKSLSDVTMYVS